MAKKLLATVLTLVLFVGICPVYASAEANIEIGDIVTFGTYEQDNNRQNGTENIEWIVLDKDGDAIFVVSRYIIDRVRYNGSSKKTTWESSNLREWLNNDFINAAFDEESLDRIITTELYNEDNPKNGTTGGKETEDKIFILSESEVEYYMEDKEDRFCLATKYAEKRGVCTSEDYDDGGWWTLRTPGVNRNYVCYISGGGGIHTDGLDVNSGKLGVRPAMWLDIS